MFISISDKTYDIFPLTIACWKRMHGYQSKIEKALIPSVQSINHNVLTVLLCKSPVKDNNHSPTTISSTRRVWSTCSPEVPDPKTQTPCDQSTTWGKTDVERAMHDRTARNNGESRFWRCYCAPPSSRLGRREPFILLDVACLRATGLFARNAYWHHVWYGSRDSITTNDCICCKR